MRQNLRLLASAAATIGLLAATVGTVSAGRPTSITTGYDFKVYTADGNAASTDDVVLVTRQISKSFSSWSQYEACTKDPNTDANLNSSRCLGTSNTKYERYDVGYPWMVVANWGDATP